MGRWIQVGWLAVGVARGASEPPVSPEPPPPVREFRGAWIATVGNLHWPSRPGLPPAEQQAELRRLLDAAAELGLNAIILQVRPAADAFYASRTEPWSPWLTGHMGQAPEPFYDPLAFAVREAHRRGLELHAWFNPFRALVRSAKTGPVAAQHITRTRPEWVRPYGSYLWLDPGEPAVHDHVIQVVLDVVRRYEVDGVHFDDYFYPYPEKGPDGRVLPFPDESTWQRYGRDSGLDRDSWRRRNVDRFIQRMHQALKQTRPTVKFGISPFGIWRPDHPPGIRGLDAYSVLYADARKWLREGWLDYCAPQLYWPSTAKGQSFPALLDWWNAQNLRHRHVWPGLNTTMAEQWGQDELVRQIRSTQRQQVSAGHIHWHLPALLEQTNLVRLLRSGPYAQAALVPGCSWMPGRVPDRPRLEVGTESGTQRVHLHWRSNSKDPVPFWYLQVLQREGWTSRRLGGETRSCVVEGARVVAVRAVAPNGLVSQPAIWRRSSAAGAQSGS